MKVLHISTMDNQGAGKAAFRLHSGLRSIGVESKMLVLNRTSSDQDVLQLSQDNNVIRRVWNKVRYKLISDEFTAYKNTRLQGAELFTDDRTSYAISKHPLVQDADIINLRWIAGMVDYEEFFSGMRRYNKPLVWRLSDMNPFTGGCHYSGGCKRYQDRCGYCPNLGSEDPGDLSRRIFKRKEKAYKNHDIRIVTISKWHADCVRKSILFKNFEPEVIPNGLPTDIFKRRDRLVSRDLLGLPQDKILLLFGADYVSERKGLKYLIEALKLINSSNIALVTFGPKQSPDIFSNMSFPVYQLGHIHDELLLSLAYSSSDLFIMPSLEEAFGQTCLEAMACGVALVGFNTGGIPDMITPQKTGLLAEKGDARDLARKIEYLITRPKERQQMGENARRMVEEKYTLQVQARNYLKIYQTLLRG